MVNFQSTHGSQPTPLLRETTIQSTPPATPAMRINCILRTIFKIKKKWDLEKERKGEEKQEELRMLMFHPNSTLIRTTAQFFS